MERKNRFIEIAGHDIKWSCDNQEIEQLPETEIEHILYRMSQCVYSEEVIQLPETQKEEQQEFIGNWQWEVINWKSIAYDLYNAFNCLNEPAQVAANKLFLENIEPDENLETD